EQRARIRSRVAALPAITKVIEQTLGRANADVRPEQRRLELLKRILRQCLPTENGRERPRKTLARKPEPRFEPLAPWTFVAGRAFEKIEHSEASMTEVIILLSRACRPAFRHASERNPHYWRAVARPPTAISGCDRTPTYAGPRA